MSRQFASAELAAILAQQGEFVHLLELEFSGGTVRFTSGPHSITWDGNLYSAAGSAMTFAPIEESTDPRSQRMRLVLDGVSQGAVAALLSEGYLGREGRLYRGHLVNGALAQSPGLLFYGFMNAPWEVTESIEEGSSRIETELVGPLSVLSQVQGITCDLNSHQVHYPADTFFSHITGKPVADFGWGILEKVPSKRLG